MTITEAKKACKRLLGPKVKPWFGEYRETKKRIIKVEGRNLAGDAMNWAEAVANIKAHVAELARIRAEAAKLGNVSRAAVLRELRVRVPTFTKCEYNPFPRLLLGRSRQGFRLYVDFDGPPRSAVIEGEDWAEIMVRLRETDVEATADTLTVISLGGAL